MQQPSPKVYVEVNVHFTKEGQMRPRSLVWEDGVTYDIDRVKKVRPSHAERAGGQGDRYTIIVNGRERYLFFEHNADFGNQDVGRWFLERRE